MKIPIRNDYHAGIIIKTIEDLAEPRRLTTIWHTRDNNNTSENEDTNCNELQTGQMSIDTVEGHSTPLHNIQNELCSI